MARTGVERPTVHAPPAAFQALDPTVEHVHALVAQSVEHPPQARTVLPLRRVVDHDGVAVSEPELAHAIGESGGVGEGMTSGARRSREVPVEVDEDGARDVALRVLDVPALGLTQEPAHIRDTKRRVVQRVKQLVR